MARTFEAPAMYVAGQLIDDGEVTAGVTDVSKSSDEVISDGADWRRELSNQVT